MKPHASWIATAFLLALLAVGLGVIFKDSLSQPSIKSDIATDVRTVSSQADTSLGEIVAGVSVSQTFQATEPNMARIEVLLSTYQRQNTTPLLLSLREHPPADAPLLRRVEARPDTIRDNSYHAFEFAPIPDSSGRTFLLTLEAPGALTGNAFTALIGQCDCYSEGDLILQGETQSQLDLAFRLGYKNRRVSSVSGELLDRMSQYKPWFFKGAALSALGLLSLAFIVLAVGSFTSSLLNDKDTRVSWAWIPVASTVIVAFSLWFILS